MGLLHQFISVATRVPFTSRGVTVGSRTRVPSARRGGDIRFVKCSRMLADLAGGHADRTIGQRMREYTRPLVLIVDDFAMREHTPTQSDDLYDLVSDRAIAAKPLILTSNRAPKDLVPAVPEPRHCRIAAGPTDQHQPSGPHGRPVLPAPETTPNRYRLTTTTRAATLASTAPQREELRDRRHLDVWTRLSGGGWGR